MRVTSTRLVSLARRSIAAIEYKVEVTDDQGDLYVALQSDLLANEADAAGGATTPAPRPRSARPLQSELAVGRGRRAVLVHQTKRSQLRMAAGMDHVIEIPDTQHRGHRGQRRPRPLHAGRPDPARRIAEAGQVPGLRLVLAAVGPGAARPGRGGAGHRQARRLGPAGARAARAARPALGRGRRRDRGRRRAAAGRPGGHVPRPAGRAARRAAADPGQGPHRPRLRRAHLLGHRDLRAAGAHLHRAARGARRAALAALDAGHWPATGPGCSAAEGAAFPWRTIRGEETSGYWPAGTAAFHINADIADAVVRYYNATLDDDFDRDFGAELLIETARLWASLGHFDAEHGFRIDGVTGPDEYTAVVDNNVYTNLMAQRNLREAAEAVKRQPDVAGRLDVDPRRGGGVAAGRRR